MSESDRSRLSGTAIGLVNSMITGAGALFQSLLGILFDLGWKGDMAAAAPGSMPSAPTASP